MYNKKKSKGLHTKFKIIAIAKNLFYTKGYKKTSIKEICELTNISPGNFTYYFPTKNDLVKEIFTEHYMRTYSFVESNTNTVLTSIEKNVYTAYPFFLGIFNDNRMTSFYNEILHMESPYDYLGHNFRHVYRQFCRELNLYLDDVELKNLIYADLGMRRELVIRFIKDTNGQSVYDLVDNFYIFRARLMKMDENVMIQYLKNAFQFEKNFDHSHINLL